MRTVRHPNETPKKGVLLIVCFSVIDIILPSYKVACTMLGIFAVPMVVASLFAANYSTLPSVLLLFLLCLASLYCHESAHLIALRLLSEDSRQGIVKSSWTQLWIVGTNPLTSGHAVIVALLGPLVGAMAALVPLLWSSSYLPYALLAMMHLSNLAPFFPDGKSIIVNLLALLLKKHRI